MLLGPTAAGKSALALELARRYPVEIISVDSAQVYRGMDIGTAKPNAEERAAAPHHLIDIIEPTESYSAARFVADARRLCAQIRARGHLPLLAGGTMLYARAFMGGLAQLPPADARIRARLDAQAAQEGWPALHAKLAAVDPDTAARLDVNDSQRIQRALEVFESSGHPLSSLLARAAGHDEAPEPLVLVSIEPSQRTILHQRITARFEAMIAAGLLAEVARLRARGDLHPALPSMRAVGYRQAWSYLDAHPQCDADAATDPHEPALRSLLEQGTAATRQLARRQLTWLRAMPQRTIIDSLADNRTDALLALVTQHWPQ